MLLLTSDPGQQLTLSRNGLFIPDNPTHRTLLLLSVIAVVCWRKRAVIFLEPRDYLQV